MNKLIRSKEDVLTIHTLKGLVEKVTDNNGEEIEFRSEELI